MPADFVDEVRRIVDRLRKLDRRCTVFGASRHRYRFEPPLDKRVLEEFERRNGVVLPASYRRFLLELGNGGPGPFYGVLPLNPDAAWIATPFPGTEHFEFEYGEPVPGAASLFHYGCGVTFLLVLNGESAGQVWVDARTEGEGVSPVTDRENRPVEFERFWLDKMQADLDRFETILALMREGTDHDEIHARLEPRIRQPDIDETMLSIMDCDPKARPTAFRDKLWGGVCGLVDDHYAAWCAEHVRR